MKTKYRFTKLFISLLMILSLFSTNVYSYPNVAQKFTMDPNTLFTGKVVPSTMVNDAFSDKVNYDELADLQFKNSFNVSGDDITINLSLFIDSSKIELSYIGKLYKSRRHTSLKPVYVGAFESTSTSCISEIALIENTATDFEIIYFEISNDISPYNLNNALREVPSITMYLRSSEGTIYDLGSKIDSSIVLDEVTNQAPSDNDINWFFNYFAGTYEEYQNTSTRSTYDDTWAGEVHSVKYQIANYEHSYLATPYIDFSYGDVPTAGDKIFGMSLKISESHRYRVVGATSWTKDTGDYTRCFWIDNVQLTWTAGGNTEITYVVPHLKLPEQGSNYSPFWGLTAAVTGVFPQTATLSAILTAADSILGLTTGSTISFTNGEQGGTLANTKAYKLKFPSSYYIEKSSYGLDNPSAERFEYVANMATTDSSLPRQYWTYAIADFTFTLGWETITGLSGSRIYSDYVTLGYYNNY